MAIAGLFPGLFAQSTDNMGPSQNDILKVHITSPLINEARLLFEKELGVTSSLEFGIGYVYPNSRMVELSGNTFLASGFSVQTGFRWYNDRERYFYPRFFRSYISPVLFYSSTGFSDEWFNIVTNIDIPNRDDECQLWDTKYDQVGLKLLFGWQSRAGKAVIDLYGGIGGKMVFSETFIRATNIGEDRICEIIPTTIFPNERFSENDFRVTFHIGAKFGFRFNDEPRANINLDIEEDW